jgi:HD-GYP domain-containing protein (c-di-GMP phosphodiesterase class II)
MTMEAIFAPFRKIRVKAALFVLLLLVSATLTFYIITIRIMNQRITTEVIKRAESLSRSMASTTGYSLISKDLLGLDNIVFRIKTSNPDIEYITIVNPDGEILVHSDIKKTGQPFRPATGKTLRRSKDGTTITEITDPSTKLFEISSPVTFMEKTIGSIVLGINKSALFEAQLDARKKIIWVFACVLVVGVASSILLSSFLTKPIKELSAGVAGLKEGTRSHPLRIYSRDELGRLTESFNEMTALITSQQSTLSKNAQDLEEACVSTVRVLAAAIDARDNYTLGHSTRVAQLSLELGRDIGLGRQELEELEITCLFHDVGKIKLPDSILLKKGKLDPPEQREMMRHTEYGTEILSKAPSLFRYIPAVRHHHEWYDGSGYPDGQTGERIPLAAAIITLADVYDAMTSDRPYRDALTEEDAVKNIEELAGRQFAPDLTARFIKIIKKRTAESAHWPRTAQ